MKPIKPVIAIIGRPNVGKSTLFNRLITQRKAIVIDEPGATRDRNYGSCEWQGRSLMLVDTGGFEPTAGDPILVQMREQALLAIEEAEAIIFLLDGKTGLTPADKDIAEILRKINKPVFYVVNKVDNSRQELASTEFYALGVEKIYTISAQHGLGIHEMMSDLVMRFPKKASEDEEEQNESIKVAVIGRPNVGKSSLVNKILGEDRVIVNPLPGTTRDPIDTLFTWKGKNFLLIDTAGIRRKSRISLTMEKYCVIQAIKTIQRCDIALLVIDAIEGITEQDVKIAGLALEEGKALIFTVNKWDAVSKDEETASKFIEKIREKAKFISFAPVLFVSALTGKRVYKILDTVKEVYAQYTRRVSTGVFNRICRDIIAKNPPPVLKGKRNSNFTYMTQVDIKPPTFVFFGRDPGDVHFSYERYLANSIRSKLGFNHVPIRIIFRKKGGK
ncbi:MAG: ribosome biogenesis GTPase Der [Syntrophales bacterium]|nr:ribosome biogenesis GTPase Der [Syntrophales bacterium]